MELNCKSKVVKSRHFKVTEISQLPAGLGINIDVKDDDGHVVVSHSIYLSYDVIPEQLAAQIAASIASCNNFINLGNDVKSK